MKNADATGFLGSKAEQTARTLPRYAEMSLTWRDEDSGASVYSWLDAHASTVRASEIDLGLDF